MQYKCDPKRVLTLVNRSVIDKFPPQKEVYVPFEQYMFTGFKHTLMASEAFLSEPEAKTHFWFNKNTIHDKGCKPWIEKMTVRKFIEKTFVNGPSANPFESIARVEFLSEYTKKYGSL